MTMNPSVSAIPGACRGGISFAPFREMTGHVKKKSGGRGFLKSGIDRRKSLLLGCHAAPETVVEWLAWHRRMNPLASANPAATDAAAGYARSRRPIRAGGTIREREVTMKPVLFRRSGWPVLKNIGWNLVLLVLGSVLCGVAINGILIPHRFVSGGVTGLALVLHYLLPALSVAADLRRGECAAFPGRLVLHQPPVLPLQHRRDDHLFRRRRLGGSSASFRSRTSFWPPSWPASSMGTGSGIILKSLGSAGGTDILSVILLQRFSIRLGTTRSSPSTSWCWRPRPCSSPSRTRSIP